MDLHTGRLQAHPSGTASSFPDPPLEGGGDIYIAATNFNEAVNGDRVVARIERIKDGGRAEGRIIRILDAAAARSSAGMRKAKEGIGHVTPFDRRMLMEIIVAPGQNAAQPAADMVTVEDQPVADGDACALERHRSPRRYRRAGRRYRDIIRKYGHPGRTLG